MSGLMPVAACNIVILVTIEFLFGELRSSTLCSIRGQDYDRGSFLHREN